MHVFRLAGRHPRAAILALVGGLLLGLCFTPLPIGGRFAAKSLNAQLMEQTGLRAEAPPGDIRFTLLPFPKIAVANLRIASPEGTQIAQIGVADAYLRPLDLIGGRLRFSGYDLQGPRVDASSPATRDVWRRAGAFLVARETAGPPLGHLAISGGSAATGDDPITDVAGAIIWTGASSPMSIWGVGRWKGEPIELRLSDLRLGDYLSGRVATPLRLMAKTPFASVEAQGSVTGGANPRSDGALRVAVNSSGRLARWLGAPTPLAGVIDRYVFEGQSVVTPRGVNAAAATLTAGTSRFEGTLALRFDEGRPQLSGTLATQTLDFDALGGAVDAMQEPAGGWSSDRFDPAPLRHTDIDLRLSAGRVRVLGARLDDAALSITLKAGRLEFVLGRAQAYQGELRGRASLIALEDAGVETRVQATFDNLDVGAAMQDVAGRRSLTGRGQGVVQLESTGGSPVELARNLAGKVTAQFLEGDLAGLNLAVAVRRPDRLAAGPVDFSLGRTSFVLLEAGATISQGVADVQEATLANGPMRARASGEISVRDQSIRLEGRAVAPSLPGDGLPFSLRGPWRRPDMRWDPVGIFRRS